MGQLPKPAAPIGALPVAAPTAAGAAVTQNVTGDAVDRQRGEPALDEVQPEGASRREVPLREADRTARRSTAATCGR
jgi:hypothetical protein